MKRKFLPQKALIFFSLLFLSISIFPQTVRVEGTVTDADTGETLIGVAIMEKGTGNGTITDIHGRYSIDVRPESVLLFTHLGYISYETKPLSPTLHVTMEQTRLMLDEVIVVGYGVQKKSIVTAAISRVTEEELDLTRPSRLEDVLKGKAAGVQITQSSGQPGSDAKVRVRGIGTVNNSDPLYIVDGMAVDGGINFLNPMDIESVEVLKDAASAAVYGTRGANGVILVTTKSGRKARKNAEVNYSFSIGWQNPRKHKSVLNATEYMTLMNESATNDGRSAVYSPSEISAAGKGTNWQKEMFNYDAPVQNHQLSVAGKKETFNYFFSFGYFNQEGIIGGDYNKSNYERYSLRVNTEVVAYQDQSRSFLNKLDLGIHSGYSRVLSRGVEENSEYGTIQGSAVTLAPNIPVYAINPQEVLQQYPNAVKDKNDRVFSIPFLGFQEIANPVAMLNAPTANRLNEDKLVATFWGKLTVYKGLFFKTSYGADLTFWGNDGYMFPYFLAPQRKNILKSTVHSDMHRSYTWQVENTLNYTKDIGMHHLTVLLGQSAKKHTYKVISGNDTGLLEETPEKAFLNYAVGNEKGTSGGTGGYTAETLASYFGRLSYNYAEKYLLELTIRRDGSSRFGANNKWATFPSISTGWTITNEEYMKKRPDWFSYMKLRLSWGRNGNENIGNFRYMGLMDGGQNYYFGSGGYSSMNYGSSSGRYPNPDIRWEQSEQIDVGLDARFFNHALSFTVDYFYKRTKDMLMEQPIPGYVGREAPIANAGKMENRGIELETVYQFNISKVSFKLSANASYITNKAVNLGNESGERIYAISETSGIGSYVKGENGKVFPFFYGFKTGGILQTQAEADAYNSRYGEKAKPGDVIFLDIAGAYDANGNPVPDGRITDADKVKIGKGMPDWVLGVSLHAKWKDFDASVFFQGVTGNDIFDFFQRVDIPAMNRPSWMMGRWHGEGTSNKIPRMTSEDPNRNWRSSDLYIKDGSYVRMKSVQVGYTLPQRISKKAAIEHLRVFVTGENLLTFTGYKGYDPEIASGDYFNIGVDKGIYPQSKSVTVGATVSF